MPGRAFRCDHMVPMIILHAPFPSPDNGSDANQILPSLAGNCRYEAESLMNTRMSQPMMRNCIAMKYEG